MQANCWPDTAKSLGLAGCLHFTNKYLLYICMCALVEVLGGGWVGSGLHKQTEHLLSLTFHTSGKHAAQPQTPSFSTG